MNDHPEWTQRARALLDESAQNLDAATLSRLNRARQIALAQRRRNGARAWMLPAGFAGACMLLLAAAVWRGHAPPRVARNASVPVATTTSDADANDADALNDDDDFYEDLDFYAWLDAQDPDDNG